MMSKFDRFSRIAAAIVGGVLIAGSAMGPAWAEYLLGPGDKLDISVYGAPDLQRKTAVSVDGQVAIPLIGNVPVEGLTLDQAKRKIEGVLAEKGIVKTPDVSIDITDHRPLFMTGDIARPGSFPYQPGMTVRQAVALAGGYDLVRFHYGQNPFVQAAELRADYNSLRTELARSMLKLAALKAELDGKSDANFGTFTDIPMDEATFKGMVDLERKQLQDRVANSQREVASLKRQFEFANAQVVALDSQLDAEKESVTKQEEEAEKIRGLFEKGLAPSSRYLDEQRSALLSRSRLQGTQALAATAKKGAEDARRQLERATENKRAETLSQITQTQVDIDRIKNRIESAAEKFAVIGSARSAVLAVGGGAEVNIYRRVGGKPTTIRGGEDMPVEPGDVVEVTLKASKLLGAAVGQ